jgi:hypothetical protein
MSVISVDSWMVKDRWWTTEPEVREYIEVELVSGRRVTYIKEAGGEWRIFQREAPRLWPPKVEPSSG